MNARLPNRLQTLRSDSAALLLRPPSRLRAPNRLRRPNPPGGGDNYETFSVADGLFSASDGPFYVTKN